MEGPKTQKEEDYSRWKGQRQIKRKTVTGRRAKDRERGRLFFVEGPKTEKEEDCSSWKGQRQRKRKTVLGGRATYRERGRQF